MPFCNETVIHLFEQGSMALINKRIEEGSSGVGAGQWPGPGAVGWGGREK